MTSLHSTYCFSVTVASDDKPVIGCLRSLAMSCQKRGNNKIPWGGTKDSDWARDGRRVTFRFTTPEYRALFIAEAQRVLQPGLWFEVTRSDADPATPQ